MLSSLLLCSAVTLYTETTPFAIQFMPKGSCKFCCPVNEKEDISFLLYTKINKEFPQRLYLDSESDLEESFLNKNHTTVFYIHGFTELKESKSARTLKQAFLDHGQFNLILVDWSTLAAAPWYFNAVRNVRRVGKYCADFIKFLHRCGIPLESIYIVGFSLGAEVAGFVGKEFPDPKLPRITGLDPAYPMYVYGNKKSHLTTSDAEFVDIIHTDGGIFGFQLPLGHVDFYPNGGRPIQPGCTYQELKENNNVKDFLACSHNRAWNFYAESVNNPTAFPAARCSSYRSYKLGRCQPKSVYDLQYMGLLADRSKPGKYYLDTHSIPPYGMGYDSSIENKI